MLHALVQPKAKLFAAEAWRGLQWVEGWNSSRVLVSFAQIAFCLFVEKNPGLANRLMVPLSSIARAIQLSDCHMEFNLDLCFFLCIHCTTFFNVLSKFVLLYCYWNFGRRPFWRFRHLVSNWVHYQSKTMQMRAVFTASCFHFIKTFLSLAVAMKEQWSVARLNLK